MCTQSITSPRPTTPDGSIPSAYFGNLLTTSNQVQSAVTTVATTTLASTSATSTAKLPAISAKEAPVDRVAKKIDAMLFLVDAMDAVAEGSSLDSFMNTEFDEEDRPHVTIDHLSIAIHEFSIKGMCLLEKFDWDPPYSCAEIIFDNLMEDFKGKNHRRIINYLPFILAMIHQLNWKPYFFHIYYLTNIIRAGNSDYGFKRDTSSDDSDDSEGCEVYPSKHLPILNEIQKAYQLNASTILSGLTTVKKLEYALESPFLKLFNISEKDVKQKIADLKAEAKKVKK